MCAIGNAIVRLATYVANIGAYVENAIMIHLNSVEVVALVVAQDMFPTTQSRDFGGA